MFWLYFVRDFYGTTNTQASSLRAHQPVRNHHVISSQLCAPVYNFTLDGLNGRSPSPHVEAPVLHITSVASKTIDKEAKAQIGSANAHLQRLSMESDHAFGVWDPSNGFHLFSANFERVTGLKSGECSGHEWIHFVHHDQQYALNESLLKAVQGKNGRCLVQAQSLQDEWRWLMIDVKAPTPQQPHIMVLWRDLTEQKALEETLKHMESSLALSERGRSAFLSSMSHELRTPLNAIMGFSEMMKSGILGDLSNPTYQQYTQHIHDSGSVLLQKVNDLLDIASMDVGALNVEETVFPVQTLLEDAMAIHSHLAFSKGILIRIDCSPTLEMRADRSKLICSMSHLISNALRHSDENGEITLSARANADDGLILSVRDSGEGIAPVQLQLIREALNSNVAYFNIACGGIGLGLSLTKELIARHDGKLMVDSMRYRGSIVSIILPTERVASVLAHKRRARPYLAVVAE